MSETWHWDKFRLGGIKSFVSGYASVFKLYGGIEVPDWSRGPERDAQAWARDWANIGGDIRMAMDKIGHEG